MVTKRNRTEYMKRFKDPKWETYAKCYEEMVKYRLTRRLLEQTHNPWFWNGDCDSESSESSPHSNKVEPIDLKDSPIERDRRVPPKELLEHKIPTSEVHAECNPPETPPHIDGQGAVERGSGELDGEKQGKGLTVYDSGKKTYSRNKAKQSRKHPRAGSLLRESKVTGNESRHPFAMYGAGDRPDEMASKKTHNVGPAASTNEIHTSAIRAKTRREIEKQVQKADRRKVQSAKVENLTKAKPDFDPWMTEYMRCFSARSR
ncbi:hypothetical protein DPEC_G00359540 [Dallia pectoralis]|uniref:Uncharacterized protein n=1 Tax=Dallia pectoralis TaxID=75939 RepID=A0ACC2F0M8_DALPE|nr:hypothetical protein DPEC_G00359540 [Dallia pectoralis]